MSRASIEEDQRVALQISRELNANPRRTSISHSASKPTEISPKREICPRGPEIELPLAPVSTASTPPKAHSGSDNSSSPLSSLHSSRESPSSNSPPSMVLRSSTTRHKLPDKKQVAQFDNDIIPPALQGRKPRGLSKITISEANARSNPPPGPELLEKVYRAKEKGEVPQVHDSSVVRLVDGKWMAPQMCNSCQGISTLSKQRNRTSKCDRKHPCSICTANGSECEQGNLMTYVIFTRRVAQLSKIPRLGLRVDVAAGFTLASHVSQNQDGTWNYAVQTQLCDLQLKKRKAEELDAMHARRRSPSEFPQTDSHFSAPLEANSNIIASLLKGKKRKADDDDEFKPPPLNPSPESLGEGVLTSKAARSLKRRSTVNGNASHVKYHRSMQEDKPAPYGQPPVWADKRQSLCETLPYYRAYQSGAYMHNKIVRAFMADKEVGPRDKFEEEIMICRVGGGRKLDEQSGQMILQADQDKSAFSLGFQRAMGFKLPVAVIAGQGNKISPSKLPHYYNVLDWFHVTDVWCEKNSGFKCWMVRLEKILLNTKSWWAPIDSQPLDPNRDINAIKTSAKVCISCKTISKEIYNAGWTCLNTSCASFFDFKKEVDDTTLDYNKEFMAERTQYTGGLLDPLAPALLTDEFLQENGGFGVERWCKFGIVCPQCKGCSRRIEWRKWTCETPGCGFTHSVLQRTMKVHNAISQSFNLDEDHHFKDPSIRFSQKNLGMYDVSEYIIPGQGGEVVGIIRHFRANGIINGQPDGPNDLFHLMQEREFGLKRYPVRQHGSPGEILTSHWAANWGAPYKYSVAVLSKGFDEAPPVIIKALKRLTWAGEQTVTEALEPFHPFNELLSIGYFEESSIGYHDDGEKELGPTVATLSLGGQALMTLRPKAKSNIGPESKNSKGTKLDVLKMVLRHGDLVVMHGTGIQKLYDHAVQPQGTLRFALTCRYVRPELMANDEERRQAEIKGRLPSGHEQYTYDGDVGKQLIELDEGSETVAAAQAFMNDLAARAITGELDITTLEQCYAFLGQLRDRMAVPEISG